MKLSSRASPWENDGGSVHFASDLKVENMSVNWVSVSVSFFVRRRIFGLEFCDVDFRLFVQALGKILVDVRVCLDVTPLLD